VEAQAVLDLLVQMAIREQMAALEVQENEAVLEDKDLVVQMDLMDNADLQDQMADREGQENQETKDLVALLVVMVTKDNVAHLALQEVQACVEDRDKMVDQATMDQQVSQGRPAPQVVQVEMEVQVKEVQMEEMEPEEDQESQELLVEPVDLDLEERLEQQEQQEMTAPRGVMARGARQGRTAQLGVRDEMVDLDGMEAVVPMDVLDLQGSRAGLEGQEKMVVWVPKVQMAAQALPGVMARMVDQAPRGRTVLRAVLGSQGEMVEQDQTASQVHLEVWELPVMTGREEVQEVQDLMASKEMQVSLVLMVSRAVQEDLVDLVLEDLMVRLAAQGASE